jgi:hypothetical protein
MYVTPPLRTFGIEYVSNTGVATATFVSGGGAQQVVLSGGVASNTSVGSDGFIFDSGGTVSNAVVSSAGTEFVFSGGAIAGVTTLSGGTLEVKSGGIVGSSTIGFAGNGHLVLDNSQAFPGSAAISGFGVPGDIDLVDIAFGSGTTRNFVEAGGNQSGTLTVSDGTNVATLTLLGQYVTANFHLATDGHGGTLVTDPPVSSGAGVVTPAASTRAIDE